MGYINNELEELAREEFFRLKKVLDIKRKIRAAKEDKKEKPAIPEAPKKRKATRKILEPIQTEEDTCKCVICGNVIKDTAISEEEKALQEKKLEELKAQINEIMEMTKGLNKEGILATDVNEFLRTAEELTEQINTPEELDFENIELDIDINELCYACKIKYTEWHKRQALIEEEKAVFVPEEVSRTLSPVNVFIKELSKDTVKSATTPQPETSELFTQIQSDVELGTFETEEKEIIKIIRTKNEDGTISEQKKVIKIKREVKTPVRGKSAASTNISTTNQPSQTSGKSNPYSASRTVGVVRVNSGENDYSRDTFQRQAKSLPITPTSQMSEPVERFCMSSVTLLSTDLDAGLISSSDEYISITLNNSHPTVPVSPNYKYVRNNVKSQSCVSFNLSVSDNDLFNSIQTKTCSTVKKYQSNDDVIESKGRRNKIKQSVSFSAKEKKAMRQ